MNTRKKPKTKQKNPHKNPGLTQGRCLVLGNKENPSSPLSAAPH